MKKAIGIILLTLCWNAVSLSAASVSVMVIETGLPNTSPVSRYSAMWESSLMEVLFEAGHIVSNVPITRIFSAPEDRIPKQAEDEISIVGEGGMKYFLAVVIRHPVPAGTEVPKPSSITIYLYDTKSGEKIMEQNYTDDESKSAREERENIKKTIEGISGGLR